MARKNKDIEALKGKTNPHILLIAPHGVAGDDENTGDLVRSMHDILECPAIINEVYRKPAKTRKDPELWEVPDMEDRILNLNWKPQAERHKKYIQKIMECIKNPALTTVFWIHGIDDENLKTETEKMGVSDIFNCLIGFGQPDNHTVNDETVDKLIKILKRKGFSAAPTRNGATNYRGVHPDNMNQFFKVSQNGLKDVRSIQLEFGYKDIRDPVSLYKTAKTFSNALIELVDAKPVIKKIAVESDTVLVSKAFEYLRDVFKRHFHDAMLDAGRYLIKEFYADNYQLAAINKKVKKASLNSLITELQKNSGNAPSKTWIYDAVRLAVDDHFYNNERFRAYGNLGHSQKLRLAYLRDPESKELLINETDEKNLKDRDLRKRIADERVKKINGKRSANIFRAIKNPDRLFATDLIQARKFDSLNKLNDEKIDNLKTKTAQKVEDINSEIERISAKIEKHKDDLANYSRLIKRFDVVKKWHAELNTRDGGKEKPKLPKETPRLNKLREAVRFMCFWRGYDYDNYCIEHWFEYVPLEEASEHFLEILLKAGKCDLKACWDFEITKKGEFKKLGKKQVQNRIEKGTYWLSKEKYTLLTDPNYYDYK